MYIRKQVQYAILHFLVDFCCAWLLARHTPTLLAGIVVYVTYNFCAFVLQTVAGLFADIVNQNAKLVILSLLFLLMACGLGRVPLAMAVVAGLGNALFHVCGGLEIMNLAGKKEDYRATPLGIFVSTGAMGLLLGGLWGAMAASDFVVVGMLVIAILLAAFFLWQEGTENKVMNCPLSSPENIDWLWLVALLAVVAIRSYAGFAMKLPWATSTKWRIVMISCVVLGKAFGGVFMDWLKPKKVCIGSMVLAMLGLAFGKWPVPGLLGVFCFQMTMPVTLWMITRKFWGAKGTAFGMLTAALFLGYLPYLCGLYPKAYNPLLLVALSAVTMLLLLFCIVREQGKGVRIHDS